METYFTYLPLRMVPDAGPYDEDQTKAHYAVLTSALLRYKAYLEEQSKQFEDTAEENSWELKTVDQLINDINSAVLDYANGDHMGPPLGNN